MQVRSHPEGARSGISNVAVREVSDVGIQRRIQRRIYISFKLRSKINFRTLNTKMTFVSIFNFIFKIKFKLKGRGTGYRPEITSVGTLNKMVSNDMWPP